MKRKTKIEKVLTKLISVRNKLYSTRHGRGHYIDYNWETWDDPIDGIDYAIMIIEKEIKNKKKGGKIKQWQT